MDTAIGVLSSDWKTATDMLSKMTMYVIGGKRVAGEGMRPQHNNKNIHMGWWPIYTVLLFILSILILAIKTLEIIMGYMEVDDD